MKCMKRLFLLYVAVFAVLLSFQSCKFEPATVNDWKPWVLSRADVEDYTAMDVVSRFIDQRSEIVVYNKHDEKYIKWWREEIQQGDWQDGYDDQELMDRFVELQEYYSMLAKLTLMNALITSEEDEDPVLEELAKAFFKLMGDEYLLLAFYESVEEDFDLNNLKTLSRSKLKNSMVEVIGDSKDFSLFETEPNKYQPDSDSDKNFDLPYSWPGSITASYINSNGENITLYTNIERSSDNKVIVGNTDLVIVSPDRRYTTQKIFGCIFPEFDK